MLILENGLGKFLPLKCDHELNLCFPLIGLILIFFLHRVLMMLCSVYQKTILDCYNHLGYYEGTVGLNKCTVRLVCAVSVNINFEILDMVLCNFDTFYLIRMIFKTRTCIVVLIMFKLCISYNYFTKIGKLINFVNT